MKKRPGKKTPSLAEMMLNPKTPRGRMMLKKLTKSFEEEKRRGNIK